MKRIFLWHRYKIGRVALLTVYELTILILLAASMDWKFGGIGMESIILAILLFVPFVYTKITSITLPLFGGSTTVQLREVEKRIESEAQRVNKISNDAETVINSITAYILAPQLQRDIYRQHIDQRIEKQKTIIVGCSLFTESRLLCAIVSTIIKENVMLDNGTPKYTVVPKYNYGSPALNYVSLLRGQIDIFPTYTGAGFEMTIGPSLKNIAHFLQKKSVEEAIVELNKIYSESPDPLAWLTPLGFENNWEIVMLRREAEKEGIQKISDLVKRLNGQLRLGCEHEFFGREAGYGVLYLPKPSGYGLRFKEERFYRHSRVYEALAKGEVDIVDGLSTDPELEGGISRRFMIVEDDEKLHGQYFPALLVRRQFIERHPEIKIALDALCYQIDGNEMMHMIRDADRAKLGHIEAVKRIALQFLHDKHLLRR